MVLNSNQMSLKNETKRADHYMVLNSNQMSWKMKENKHVVIQHSTNELETFFRSLGHIVKV